jgi:hypothetical protein
MRHLYPFVALLSALLVAACTPKKTDIPVTGVTLSPSALELKVGDSKTLTATVAPDDATNKEVEWSSSDKTMSVIALQDGLVRAIAKGSATVTVRTVDGGKTATCSVTVKDAGSPDNPDNPDKPDPKNEPQKIDLGLPSGTIWADRNLGADKATDTGDYYAWGETEIKSKYTWDNYAWGNEDALTRYNGTDGLVRLKPEDDPAAKLLGGKWRMPLASELYELDTFVIPEFVTEGGIKCMKVTNGGKSLILPAAGIKEEAVQGEGHTGFYFSGTLFAYATGGTKKAVQKHDYASAIGLLFGDGSGVTILDRCTGSVVRPVYGDLPKLTTDITPEKSVYEMMEGDVVELKASVTPSDAMFGCVMFNPRDPSVVEIDPEGKAWAVGTGETIVDAITLDGFVKMGLLTVKVSSKEIPAQSVSVAPKSIEIEVGEVVALRCSLLPENCTDEVGECELSDEKVIKLMNSVDIDAGPNDVFICGLSEGSATVKISTDLSEVSTTCQIKVRKPSYKAPEAVDLGLKSGLKWASFNLGASEKAGAGLKFAWGETKHKSEFTLDNYNSGLDSEDYGVRPGDLMPTACDVAYRQLGTGWRVPTSEDFVELLNSCTVTEQTETIDGRQVEGLLFTSRANGKSIFLPKTSCCINENVRTGGYFYWTATRGVYEPEVFTGDGFEEYYYERGCSLRPVYQDPPYNNPYRSHSWVDLGLSVLWATENVGATPENRAGEHFSWGETNEWSVYTTNAYSWSSYKFSDDLGNITKYDGASDSLAAEDDAATVNWKGDRRMPTWAEFYELIANCDIYPASVGGDPYIQVVSKVNGARLQLAFGYIAEEGNFGVEAYGLDTYLWAKDRSAYIVGKEALMYCFVLKSNYMCYIYRYYGGFVRPVLPNPNYRGGIVGGAQGGTDIISFKDWALSK